MNEFTIIGRVVGVPEYDSTSNGTTIVRVVVEVERTFSKPDGTRTTDLFKVTSFGKTAEELQRRCNFSTLLTIKGRLQASNRTGTDGKMYYNPELIAETIAYLQ